MSEWPSGVIVDPHTMEQVMKQNHWNQRTKPSVRLSTTTAYTKQYQKTILHQTDQALRVQGQ